MLEERLMIVVFDLSQKTINNTICSSPKVPVQPCRHKSDSAPSGAIEEPIPALAGISSQPVDANQPKLNGLNIMALVKGSQI